MMTTDTTSTVEQAPKQKSIRLKNILIATAIGALFIPFFISKLQEDAGNDARDHSCAVAAKYNVASEDCN